MAVFNLMVLPNEGMIGEMGMGGRRNEQNPEGEEATERLGFFSWPRIYFV